MGIEYLEFKPIGQETRRETEGCNTEWDAMILRQGVLSSFGQATSLNIDA